MSDSKKVDEQAKRGTYDPADLSPLPGKQDGSGVQRLVGVMQRLLAPDGCPWDREQDLQSLLPYLVEETYEVVDAITDGTVEDHKEELGDLLLQIVFQSELRARDNEFGINDVADGIVEKLVRRHPHVFADVEANDSAAVVSNWAKIKAEEKAEKGKYGALDGVPRSAPGLLRATRLGEKAAANGFDWHNGDGPRAKVDEELREFDEARADGDKEAMQSELGDVLFALANMARKMGLDAESAVRETADRFTRRFGHMEASLTQQGRPMDACDMDILNGLWDQAKKETPHK